MSGTLIHVGEAAPVLRAFADFVNGERAAVQRVEIEIEESEGKPDLVIRPAEADALRWPLSEIRLVPDQAAQDTMILALEGDPVKRLLISDDDAIQVITARCGNLNKRRRFRNHKRLFAWSAGAVASVALIIFVLVPLLADRLADFLPPEGEKALGDVTFEQIRTALSENEFLPLRVCERQPGQDALQTMLTRIQGDLELPYPVSVSVLDHELVNAFTLPGGRVIIFRGLIDAAEDPDEVAAVFAHEIGHVLNRDPARGALRSAGSIGVLGLLFGDFAGGTAVLFLLNRLIDANYSQDAEAAADEFAHRALANASVPPSALATMFERLRAGSGESEGIVAHFQAHPKLGDRIEAARVADRLLQTSAKPVLAPDEWAALRKICR